jgi:hypothetical protein
MDDWYRKKQKIPCYQRCDRVTSLEHSHEEMHCELYGDGDEGLKVRLVRLEEWTKGVREAMSWKRTLLISLIAASVPTIAVVLVALLS